MFDFEIGKYLTGCEMDGQPSMPPPPEKPGHCPKPHYTLTEQVEQTARAMRETIDRVLKFEKRLDDKMTCLGKKLTADNVLFKNTFASSFSTFLADVKNEINVFEGTLNADFELFKETVKSDYTTLSDDCRNQIQENYTNFQADLNTYKTELNGTYDSFRDAVESRLENYNATYEQSFNDYCTSINKKLVDMESKFNGDYNVFVNSINAQIEAFKTEWVDTINARLDGQDSMINDAVLYLKTNLKTSVIEVIDGMKETGEITELFGEVFNSINNDIKMLEDDVRYLDNASLPKLKVITPQMISGEEIAGGVDSVEIDVPSLNRCIEKMTEGYTLYLGDYTYNVGAEAIQLINKHHIKILGNGAKIKASATPEQHSIFHLINCSDVEISGIDFVCEEAENNVTPPAGHGDIKTTGSNRLGIFATASNDLTFKRNSFSACTGDYWLVRDSEGYGVNNVVIDGWKSIQGHMGIYASGLKNATMKNIDIVPRVEIGAGNHAFYISVACEDVTIENAVVKPLDTTYSCIIAHYTALTGSDITQPTTLTVRNLTAEGAFLYSGNESAEVSFYNVNFEQIFDRYLTNETAADGKTFTTPSYCCSIFKTLKMIDCNIYSGAANFYLDREATKKVHFERCRIQVEGTFLCPYNSETKVVGCDVLCNAFLYSSSPGTKMYTLISETRIGASSSIISRRGNENGIIFMRNCDVSGTGGRVIYHGDTGLTNRGIRVLSSHFFGNFSSFSSDTEKSNGVYSGSFLNGISVS